MYQARSPCAVVVGFLLRSCTFLPRRWRYKREYSSLYFVFTLIFIIFTFLYFPALSIKTGICNFTITTPGLFACEKVSFENPFNGGQDVKVFVSKSHTTNSYSGGDGAAIWVESVDNKEFTVCVLEYGDGSSGTTKVNWMALQSVPVGAQLDTVSLDSWSTGEKCKRIAFEKVISFSLRFLRSFKFNSFFLFRYFCLLTPRHKISLLYFLSFAWLSGFNFLFLYLASRSCRLSIWLLPYIFKSCDITLLHYIIRFFIRLPRSYIYCNLYLYPSKLCCNLSSTYLSF